MRYTIETTDYGVTIYSAVQPDYNHELQVVVSANKLVCALKMHPTPTTDNRTEITKADFASAFNNATTTFTDYLKI